jgi:hypothetical protein
MFGSVTCLPRLYPYSLRVFAHDTPWIGRGGTHYPGLSLFDVLRNSSERPSAAKSRLICSCKFSSNVRKDYNNTANLVHLYF